MSYKITKKFPLNEEDYLVQVEAPEVAEKFRPGHFVVLITVPKGERVPMSIQKAENGEIAMFVKKLGKTSYELSTMQVGDTLYEVIGPMGNPPEIKKYGNVLFASDLVCGHAENYAMCKALSQIAGNHVISMQTFPNEDSIYPESELAKDVSHEHILTTIDGSRGIKGHYLDLLEEMLENNQIDYIFAGGDMPKLRDLSHLTQKYNVPTITTVRQIMVDATGMCGSCRVFVDGEMKLACIDGPMFDGHKVDWETAISRLAMFKEKEAQALNHYNKTMRGAK